LDAAVVLLLWGLAEAVLGRSGLRRRLGGMIRLSSWRLRLTVALGVFFVVPTVAFAAWVGGRLRSDAAVQRDLVTRRALRDAPGPVIEQPDVPLPDLLPPLALHVGTDLVWYENGVLADASSTLLPDLSLVDPYLPPPVYRALQNDALEVTADALI